MCKQILRLAWDAYRKHFRVVASVVLVICLPLELLSSYMDYFVFGQEGLQKSFKFARMLDNFIGIIATAGVISVGYTAWLGQLPSFGGAMRVGVSSWGRMWWTRVLKTLAVVLGFLLLILPGIYLLVRLALAEPVAVCERVSGSAAMRQSFELTKGRVKEVFLLGLVFGAVLLAALACLILPALFIPAMDHWLVHATTGVIVDLVGAFGTLCMVCAYASFSAEHTKGEEHATPNGAVGTPSGDAGISKGPLSVNQT
jgi:hypothetical protein